MLFEVPLSNHLFWLSDKKPGGHKSKLSVINNKKLFDIYEKTLQKINATTLVALARSKIIYKIVLPPSITKGMSLNFFFI